MGADASVTLFWFLIQRGGTTGNGTFIFLLSVSVNHSEQLISMQILLFSFFKAIMQREAKRTWKPIVEHLLHFLQG